MSEFLATMAASSRRRVDELYGSVGWPRLELLAQSARDPLPLRLSASGFDLIAEAKLASPSEGRLSRTESAVEGVVELATGFAAAGAAAISVLTEPDAFGGEISHLEQAAPAVGVPVMRKDFLVDPIQILEARAVGASGVLLIARLLDPGQLVEMTDLALSLGMFPLVEIFDLSDLDPASVVFDRDILVGVNSRDLASLRVDPGRHAEAVRHLPSHLPRVAESGIESAEDVQRVAGLGYRLALVGTALVRSAHPADLTFELIGAGRGLIPERPVP